MTDKPHGRQSLYFILITILIDSIGFGLIIPVMPDLLSELMETSKADVAVWGGYLAFCYAAMHFLFGPFIGNLSDRFGRRPILLISMGALVVDYLILALATSIGVLFLGRILTGICGATFSTANAYIADVTDEKKRGKAFGLVGATFGMGFILGPAIGGFLGTIDPRAPFYAAAGMSLCNMLYGYFVLPESLHKENRRSFSIWRSNPLGAFQQFRKFPDIKWLFVVCLVLFFAHVVYPSTWQFHGAARYGWGSREIGISLMAFGICSAVVQGGLIGQILKRFGERKTAFFGIACSIVAFVGFAFAEKGWILYCWIPLSALGAVATPAIKSIMSSHVPSNSQGEMQGTLSSLQGVANMISPIMMTQIFTYFANADTAFVSLGLATTVGGIEFGVMQPAIFNLELLNDIVGPYLLPHFFPLILLEDSNSHFYGAAFVTAGLLLCVGILPLMWGTWNMAPEQTPSIRSEENKAGVGAEETEMDENAVEENDVDEKDVEPKVVVDLEGAVDADPPPKPEGPN